MNWTSLWFWIVVTALVAAVGLIYSYNLGVRRQEQERDEEVGKARVKHKVLMNPIFWAYILFHVALIVGLYLVYAVPQ